MSKFTLFAFALVAIALTFTAPKSEAATVTAFYDFEGDFNDHPGAGLFADDLVNKGGSLDASTPAGIGSTQSFKFDNFTQGGNFQRAETDAYTTDLTSTDTYTVMFWHRGDDNIQNNNNTRLATVRFLPGGGAAPVPAWQVEGYGLSGGNPDRLDMRLNDPVGGNLWFSADAVGALGPLGGVNDNGNGLDDEWHHIAFVFDSTGAAAGSLTYVDGLLVGTSNEAASTGNPIGNLGGELILGGHNGRNRSATGQLDDFALFDGAVSAEDVLRIARGEINPSFFIPTVDVPEPTTVMLAMVGLGGLAMRRRRNAVTA